jgi:hypothetical protein
VCPPAHQKTSDNPEASAFDPQHPNINEARVIKCNWHDFYRGAKEVIPRDAPKPHGNVVSTHCFVDADHAGNHITRHLQTGILIFINRAPIIWYSKRQNTADIYIQKQVCCDVDCSGAN